MSFVQSALGYARRFLSPPPAKAAAAARLSQIIEVARDPRLYRDLGVADTADGRFDLVVLFTILVLGRLKREGAEGQDFAQRLFDAAFANFDDSLREMGVGDLSVGRKIRAMAEAFYGRVQAYDAALASTDPGALEAALVRNVYRSAAVPEGHVSALAAAVRTYADRLSSLSLPALIEGPLPTLELTKT